MERNSFLVSSIEEFERWRKAHEHEDGISFTRRSVDLYSPLRKGGVQRRVRFACNWGGKNANRPAPGRRDIIRTTQCKAFIYLCYLKDVNRIKVVYSLNHTHPLNSLSLTRNQVAPEKPNESRGESTEVEKEEGEPEGGVHYKVRKLQHYLHTRNLDDSSAQKVDELLQKALEIVAEGLHSPTSSSGREPIHARRNPAGQRGRARTHAP
ncbi:hypothetical protein NDN08_002268 [Rhodosorus marinus]|uniref:FAR1 domain-containing protein n=1 Tax=Rhodosorus marinus TaxID=101924 RepID=A0AAV8UTB9_9RHOD|nr:hypothetical protein NDN08_002268 [Rhodosorus marinus]